MPRDSSIDGAIAWPEERASERLLAREGVDSCRELRSSVKGPSMRLHASNEARRLMMVNLRTLGVVTVASMAVLGGSLVVLPAEAASTSCTTSLQKRERDFLPDVRRAGAKCSMIAPDHKVRAKMVMGGSSDIYSAWFTRTNTYYWTRWEGGAWSYSAAFEVRHV